jgi:hypothetical protein
MKKTFKLKTNKFINVLKLLIIFPVLVVLGITAKVVSFYYLELLILAAVFLSILWFYRITYVGRQSLDDGECLVRIRYNIFNFKFVKVSLSLNGKNSKYAVRTRESTIIIGKPNIPLAIELNLDLKSNGEPETSIKIE